uniref:Uncharacterized protein n=1 Tax=Trichogramma kaykai TaxID=54128 RepID=A0ABD2XHQ4_9HYME
MNSRCARWRSLQHRQFSQAPKSIISYIQGVPKRFPYFWDTLYIEGMDSGPVQWAAARDANWQKISPPPLNSGTFK